MSRGARQEIDREAVETWREVADLIGEAVAGGNDTWTAAELGEKALTALTDAGWQIHRWRPDPDE